MESYTFETAMERLEQIVRSLEDGKAPLDASLTAFEEGVRLVKFCTKQLDSAEQRVKLLLEQGDGAVTESAFVQSEAKE